MAVSAILTHVGRFYNRPVKGVHFLEILYAIQSMANPVLDVVFELITMLGERTILAVAFCVIYWCFDKRMGRFLLICLSMSACLNGIIKDTVRAPRPIGLPGIVSRRVETATGYSFPSGHTQSAATFWTAAAVWLHKCAALIGAVLIIACVGFSRLYLGVHFLPDVLAGAGLGILLPVGCYFIQIYGRGLVKGEDFILTLCMILATVSAILCDSADSIGASGIAVGTVFGFRFEEYLVNFKRPENALRAFIRVTVGGMVIGLVYLLPGLLGAEGTVAGAVRNALLAFTVTGGYPWLFHKLEGRRAKISPGA